MKYLRGLGFVLSAVPSPVCNLRILGVTTTQLKVGWDPPEENNGVLRGYTVYVGGEFNLLLPHGLLTYSITVYW